MNKVCKMLDKKYHTSLWKQKAYKKTFKAMKERLERANITYHEKKEFAYYEAQLLCESIAIKEQFEDTFFDTYVTMFDYWKEIDYKERKHQMNVDIDRMKQNLTMFSFEDSHIYMPAISPFLNRIYENEIVLLDLKQYARFIRQYDKETSVKYYGYLPYANGFTSAVYMLGTMDDFCVYDAELNRFYRLVANECVQTLALKKGNEDSLAMCKAVAKAWLEEDEMELLHQLLQSNLIDDKMKHKLQKYKDKLETKKGRK